MSMKGAIEESVGKVGGQSESGRPLSTTLSAVALEINDLAHLSDRLQTLISGALAADSSANPEHLREFQAIDLLVQRLHGVGIFMNALAGSIPEDWRVAAAAAASNVPLGDLARRLGSDESLDSANPVHHAPSGDLDLFG